MLLLARGGWKVSLVAGIFGVGLLTGALQGQSTWTGTDIGTTGAAGSYTFSSGTGTLTGAGTGVSGTADNFSYAYTPVSGNVEIIAQVWSQSNTSSYATAGLMIRESLAPNSAQAYLSVSPSNGVNFTARTATGATSTTTLGPSVATPVWLRIAKSGSSIAGYQSADAVTWTLVGSSTYAISGTFDMGLAVSSNVSGTLSSATFSPIVPMISVPQRTDSMQLWLRSDIGVTLVSGTNRVNQWSDQSTNGNNGTQTGAVSQPTFNPNAINGLPDIKFNYLAGQALLLPPGFSDFSSGISMFLVVKPLYPGNASGGCIQFSTGGTANFIQLVGGANYSLIFGGTVSSPNFLSPQYQVLEAVAGGGVATIYTNGSQAAQGPVSSVPNILRDLNYVGARQANAFNGEIAEVLVYNTALSMQDRQNIEVYLGSKYGIAAISPPTFSIPTATYSGSQSVTISGPSSAAIYYTTDGSPPTTASTLYTSPITVVTTTTISAISALQNATSGVSSVTITVDPDSAAVSRSGLQLWLYGNAGVVLSGSKVSQWNDQSGLGNNAVQTGTGNQPVLVPGALNSLPSVSFNGTNQYLSLPAGFADFTNGASVFVVTKPTNTGSNARFIEFGNGTASDNLMLTRSGTTTGATLFAYNGTTSSSVTGSNALTLNQYQLVEAVHSGSGTATLYTNSSLTGSGTLSNLVNTTRANNTLAVAGTGTSNFLQGEVVETLVYNTALTQIQRQAVESYLAKKYALTAAKPVLPTPVISPAGSALYAQGQLVTINGQSGATLYYTTDGSTPSGTSPIYTAPFTTGTTTTIKAIAAQSGYTTSAVASQTINIDPGTTSSAGVSRNGLVLWLRSDLGTSLTGSNTVSQWNDQSGNGNNATQLTPANQPLLVTLSGTLNNQNVLRFDGTNDGMAVADAVSLKPNQLTAFEVVRASGTTLGAFMIKSTVSPWTIGYGMGRSGTTVYGFVNAAASGVNVPLATNTYAIISERYDQTQLRLWVNGATNFTVYSSTITQTTNPLYLGSQAGSNPMQGDIAEVLLYGRALGEQERLGVESYLQQKYGVGYPAVVAPQFSNTSGTTFSQPSQVALTIPAIPTGANIYYTVDGSAPTTSSPVYNGPIWVTYTSTIKAFATATGYVSSGTVSGTFNLSGTAWPAPTPGGTPPTIQLILPTNATP